MEFLAGSPLLVVIESALLGLIVGSFLNVVIHRLPKMMMRDWRLQCHELQGTTPVDADMEPYNLNVPRSHCPGCHHAISIWENIPVISYLILRGRCKECGQRISIRYPLIETLTAVLSALVAWQFGFSWQTAAALLLTWALVPLIFIDLEHQLLPDDITLPLLWLGLGLSLFGIFTDPASAILGAMAGYLSLWSVYIAFKLLTGKEGMGYGDFKLLALFGAWLGWQAVPLIIILSSLVGSIVGITLILLRRHQRDIPIPFGPYLAAAGWIALMWGDSIINSYLNWLG